MIETEPERDDVLEQLIDAWSDLSTERPRGMSTGLIPWSRIRDWAEYNGYEREETQLIIRVIRRVDVQLFDERDARERLEKLRRGKK